VDPELAKSLRKIALKIDKLALYAFIVLAVAAARFAYPSLADWLGSGWSTAASIVTGIVVFMTLIGFYPE
jgi:hypothetical protein